MTWSHSREVSVQTGVGFVFRRDKRTSVLYLRVVCEGKVNDAPSIDITDYSLSGRLPAAQLFTRPRLIIHPMAALF